MILLVGSARAVVGFVDDQQIGGRQRHGFGADGARVQGLDRRDLHPLERARRKPAWMMP